MGKKLQIKISIGIMCCLAVIITGYNKSHGSADNDIATEPQNIEEPRTYTDEPESAERRDTEVNLPLGSGTPESMNYNTEREDRCTRYFCLEADDPQVQEYIADGDEAGFVCGAFIKGLVGFSPESDSSGGIMYYNKDKEIIIEKNVGMGLLQAERLAEVKENIREMVMDIIRERGKNARDYQEYFADEAVLQQIDIFMGTEIEEDWLLLESFYFSWYAGNYDEIWWFNKVETSWMDIEDKEEGITLRLSETDTRYHFEFRFYADYRTMGYAEDDEAAEIAFTCAVSKETGLIEEISMCKCYLRRNDFETMRWT